MAFLDMPVGRSVFLVSDLGRIKETSTAIPPQYAEALFTAEEVYVRRRPAEEEFMAEFRDRFMRDQSQDAPAVSDFTFINDAPQEAVEARASRLLDVIAQQLARLGPPGWDRFVAVFSFTVSGELARLRFWSRDRSIDVPVPEQTAVLVRRQRHVAAWMSAGPWWQLSVSVTHRGGTNAEIVTEYGYGDEPFPEDVVLDPEHYRNDLAAYPRARIPAWLAEYVATAPELGEAGPPARTAPGSAVPGHPGPRPERPVPTPPQAAPSTPRTAPRAEQQEHAAIEARIRKIGNDEELGALWGIYPPGLLSSSRLGCFGVAAAILALLGIVLLATSDALGVIPLGMAVACAVYAARGTAANSRNAGTWAATSDAGVVVLDSDDGTARVFGWRSTTVRQRIVNHTRNGVHSHTTYSYRLTGPDGTGLTLGGGTNMPGLAEPEKWGREIQEGITRAQLPVALRAVAEGDTVAFDPIQVDRRAVTGRGRSVPWSDIEQVKIAQGHVSLRVAGRWLSLINAEISEIPNFFVLHALAEHLRTTAGGGNDRS